MLTVDSCVWVSSFEPTDAFHPSARAFLIECQRQQVVLASPTIAVLETGCALSRRLQSPERGREAALLLALSPLLQLVPMHADLEADALRIGTALGLRAADAIYTALSVHLHADLVTTDRELLNRTTGALRAWTPAEWLAVHA